MPEYDTGFTAPYGRYPDLNEGNELRDTLHEIATRHSTPLHAANVAMQTAVEQTFEADNSVTGMRIAGPQLEAKSKDDQ